MESLGARGVGPRHPASLHFYGHVSNAAPNIEARFSNLKSIPRRLHTLGVWLRISLINPVGQYWILIGMTVAVLLPGGIVVLGGEKFDVFTIGPQSCLVNLPYW